MPNPLRALLVASLFVLPAAAAKQKTDNTPAHLTALLAKFDKMQPGAERDALELEIDAAAHQRYAAVSRLYWYTNLDDAKAAAHKHQQPILHLRMLGNLDEDLSCANSRFFRATLYANVETSKFLRDNFILYWSSERPVPRVTIDFGDGRKIVRTTTGNSAHYVMDEHGHVLDVLPGLYAPSVFRMQLVKSLELARSVRGKGDKELLDAVMAFHRDALDEADKQFAAVAGTDYLRRRGRLASAADIGAPAIEQAQRATYAKYVAEVADLAKIGINAGAIEPTDVAQWATIGQKVWNVGLDTPKKLTRATVPEPILLDAQSVAMVGRLRAGNPQALPMGALLARLEQNIMADSAANEFRLRRSIRLQLASGRTPDFQSLNDWIYTHVFHTPKTDAWLGLLENTDFTGLPADGVVH